MNFSEEISENEILRSLSPMTERPFEYSGMECASLVSFLCGLRIKDAYEQSSAFLLGPQEAIKNIRNLGIISFQKQLPLYLQGTLIDRGNYSYENILDQAVFSLAAYNADLFLSTEKTPENHKKLLSKESLKKLRDDYSTLELGNKPGLLTETEYLSRIKKVFYIRESGNSNQLNAYLFQGIDPENSRLENKGLEKNGLENSNKPRM